MSLKYYHTSFDNTGSFHVSAHDTNNHIQKGAEFRIAREATKDELRNDAIYKEKITFAERKYTVIYEKFISPNISTDQVSADIEMNRAGFISVVGLPDGTYFLIETKATDGFHRISNPICFTITPKGCLIAAEQGEGNIVRSSENKISIIHRKYVFTESNYTGTSFIAATGLTIISVCLMCLSSHRKKENTYQLF